MNVGNFTIKKLRDELKSGNISPSEIISSLAENIKANDKINAFIDEDINKVSELSINELSLHSKEIDLASSLLGGVPIAIKDNINVKGHSVSCASNMLKNKFISTYDAGAINKLKLSGGIAFGRTNMDEFAMGSSTENSAYGVTKNPHDLNRVSGGSSGGSAAAVAGNLCIAALGSDTGGSIRQPASFCGCVGFKPTYGRVSRYGLVAFASSLDQIGTFTKDVYDAGLLFQSIYGSDAKDSTSLKTDSEDFIDEIDSCDKNLVVGVPKEYFSKGLDPFVEQNVRETISKLEKQGVKFKEISLPNTEHAIAVYYIIATAEASTNLSRFDGVRYGHRSDKVDNLHDMYSSSREEGFGSEVKRRILLGTYVLSSGYYDAYYIKAQKARTIIKNDFDEAFKKVDMIISPTVPTTAFKIGEKVNDPLKMYLADAYTLAVNLAALPAISIPSGNIPVTDAGGLDNSLRLPNSVQVIANSNQERKLLQFARLIEKTLS